MRIEVIPKNPILVCVACAKELASNRLIFDQMRNVAAPLCDGCLNELERLFYRASNGWISVKDKQPEGSPIVFMYSESNNEYSVSHFVLNRAGVPVTHWRPLEPPTVKAAIFQQRKNSGL